MPNIPESVVDKLRREMRRNDLFAQAAGVSDPFSDIMQQVRANAEFRDPVLLAARGVADASMLTSQFIKDAGGISSIFERSKMLSSAVERAMQDIDQVPRLFREMITMPSAVALALQRSTDTVAGARFAAAAELQNTLAFSALTKSIIPDGLADVRQRMIDDQMRFQALISETLPQVERLKREMAVPGFARQLRDQMDQFAGLTRAFEEPLSAAMAAMRQSGLTAADYALMQARAFEVADEATALIEQFSADDEVPGVGDIESLLAGLLAIIVRFGTNSRREAGEMGTLSLLGYMVGIVSILLVIFPPESATDKETAETVARVEQSIYSLSQTIAAYDADSLAGLDRAVVLRAAWVRQEPNKLAQRATKLDEGTTIALRQKAGRWWQIAYRDPLTGKIAEGWIYGTLIEKI